MDEDEHAKKSKGKETCLNDENELFLGVSSQLELHHLGIEPCKLFFNLIQQPWEVIPQGVFFHSWMESSQVLQLAISFIQTLVQGNYVSFD